MVENKFETILFSIDGALARISLNRPEKLNAVNGVMVAELHQALDLAEASAQVRAVLLTGEGRAFSAGFDLAAGESAATGDAEFWRAELRRDFDIIMRFWDCSRPVIAAVHGYCLGSAMELALACDLTVAGEGCRFGVPEVRFGSGIVALVLPWLTGVKAAKELLLTGDDRVTAQRALALGLVNRVVPDERLVEEAVALATTIAGNDQLAVSLTRQAINRTMDIMGMRQALLQALELDVIVETTETPESREFNEVLHRDGVKAALAWRARRLSG